jgi:hypothetical protein
MMEMTASSALTACWRMHDHSARDGLRCPARPPACIMLMFDVLWISLDLGRQRRGSRLCTHTLPLVRRELPIFSTCMWLGNCNWLLIRCMPPESCGFCFTCCQLRRGPGMTSAHDGLSSRASRILGLVYYLAHMCSVHSAATSTAQQGRCTAHILPLCSVKY